MLARFSVKNYMGFPEKIVWDLSKPRDYAFNDYLIKDGIVKNGIIYGKNGSGKTSLGRAVFDVVSLVNNYSPTDYHKAIYQGAVDCTMDFEYEFVLSGDDKVAYSYSKNVNGQLVKEALYHSGQEIFIKDLSSLRICDEFPVDPSMRAKLADSANAVSIVKFIVGSFPLTEEHYLQKMMTFINSMLWFRCLDNNKFIVVDNGAVYVEDYIIHHRYLNDFADFLLKESGQSFDFSPTAEDQKSIYCKIGNNSVPFLDIMTTGTKSLELLFYWTRRMKEADIAFVFIDEFDAFYHFELSLNVCHTLFHQGFQVFLSSHNTMLLSNDNLRPDCGFYLRNNRIDPLCDCTDRGELRQGHNIEKMFRAGAFDDNDGR